MAGVSALSNVLLPGPSTAALTALTTASKAASKVGDKARTAAQEFEAVFLNTVFQQMFTGIDGEGPFGGAGGTGVWRSFLTDEYAKAFAKSGGIGLADGVYRTLIAQQEARQ
jgi:Rod binding domain-containing protein